MLKTFILHASVLLISCSLALESFLSDKIMFYFIFILKDNRHAVINEYNQKYKSDAAAIINIHIYFHIIQLLLLIDVVKRNMLGGD